jgi:hypothetical protein
MHARQKMKNTVYRNKRDNLIYPPLDRRITSIITF